MRFFYLFDLKILSFSFLTKIINDYDFELIYKYKSLSFNCTFIIFALTIIILNIKNSCLIQKVKDSRN